MGKLRPAPPLARGHRGLKQPRLGVTGLRAHLPLPQTNPPPLPPHRELPGVLPLPSSRRLQADLGEERFPSFLGTCVCLKPQQLPAQ